ncbi:hypothetical protein ABZU32_39110 [Sphaerisporangium sp. NPDC005288]|uniref:hypothetical protein n=1 Tax=Sphaerisporangium sp. NPDC005288 TaxID=3155114 RepID=UPI0033AA5BCC
MYETLMPRALGGGRAPSRARRVWVADALGVTERGLDAARRELLAAGEHGPWLSRSAPRGAKRSVLHLALQVPSQTGGTYAAVPAWTLALVRGGRHRPEGTISPDAWRLYALGELTRRQRDAFEASVRFLAGLLDVSADTARRRVMELEAAGLWRVAERPGAALLIRPTLTPQQAEATASAYAEYGRASTADPSQPDALTPRNQTHSPLATRRTPLESAPFESVSQESTDAPPAVGALQVGGTDAWPADAGRRKKSAAKGRATPRRPRPRAVDRRAAELYRALPPELTARIPEHGRRRVVEVLAGELAERSPAELAERIAARAEHWRYRLAEVTEPVAVAITIARRGYDCVDVRCEDHVRLDTGQPCGACAETARQITERRLAASEPPVIHDQPPAGPKSPASGSHAPTGPLSAPPPPPVVPCPSGRHLNARHRPDGECAGCWADRIAIE